MTSYPAQSTVPRVLAVSHRRELFRQSGLSWDEWVEAVAQAKLDLLVREKDLDDRQLFALVKRTRNRFANRLLVSSRPDVAREGGADGVHLPGRGLPATAVRRLWPGATVGWSLHHISELDSSEIAACDYVTLSPIQPTLSKTGTAPLGWNELARFCSRAAALDVSVLALGGMDPRSAVSALEAGAVGVAAIGSTLTREGLEDWARFLDRSSRGVPRARARS